MNHILKIYEQTFDNDDVATALDTFVRNFSLGTSMALRKVQLDNNIRDFSRCFDGATNSVRQQRTENLLRFQLLNGHIIKIGKHIIRPANHDLPPKDMPDNDNRAALGRM